ncbi:MAG: ROK family transcriptional regulator [Rhizobiales bacterium]|nr:ROK family transcriptional regulator [Hyphomicrobiales bacterium]
MTNPVKVSRQVSQSVVMQAIAQDGPISRASLAKQIGLSKQTISEVVKQLEKNGWVKVTGQTSGHIGRTAVTYEVNPTSTGIIVVDLGGTKVRAVVVDLVGNITSDLTEPTDPVGKNAVIDQIIRMCKSVTNLSSIDNELVKLAVIGVPGVPDFMTGAIKVSPNISGLDEINVTELISEALGLEVVLENDVNLAVLGEQWLGDDDSEFGLDNLVFISLGTGIGAGIIINGQIVRGVDGSAGELGFLPFGSDATSKDALHAGAFENAVGTDAIVKLYKSKTGELKNVKEIFNIARLGEPIASEIVSEVGFSLARAIAAITSLINPEKIIMGGSIGRQDILINAIKKHLPKFMKQSPAVTASTLDGNAALIGGIAIGLEQRHATLFAPDMGNAMVTQFPAPNKVNFLGGLKNEN